jgi:hypothetical protein
MKYLFVEMTEFTRRIVKLGLEDDLRMLQTRLGLDPSAGKLDPGTCGLRKIRMTDVGRAQGKSFGARVHYLVVPRRERIYLIHVYPKNEQDTLTPEQKKLLCRLVFHISDE